MEGKRAVTVRMRKGQKYLERVDITTYLHSLFRSKQRHINHSCRQTWYQSWKAPTVTRLWPQLSFAFSNSRASSTPRLHSYETHTHLVLHISHLTINSESSFTLDLVFTYLPPRGPSIITLLQPLRLVELTMALPKRIIKETERLMAEP